MYGTLALLGGSRYLKAIGGIRKEGKIAKGLGITREEYRLIKLYQKNKAISPEDLGLSPLTPNYYAIRFKAIKNAEQLDKIRMKHLDFNKGQAQIQLKNMLKRERMKRINKEIPEIPNWQKQKRSDQGKRFAKRIDQSENLKKTAVKRGQYATEMIEELEKLNTFRFNRWLKKNGVAGSKEEIINLYKRMKRSAEGNLKGDALFKHFDDMEEIRAKGITKESITEYKIARNQEDFQETWKRNREDLTEFSKRAWLIPKTSTDRDWETFLVSCYFVFCY